MREKKWNRVLGGMLLLPSLSPRPPSVPLASSLRDRCLLAAVRELYHGRISSARLSLLPHDVLPDLLKAAKAANLLRDDTVELFFPASSDELVLSGASCFVRRLPEPLPHALVRVGLYNCSSLTEQQLDAVWAHASRVEELNVGRLKGLRDRHVLALPECAPALRTLVLNRNAQLTDAALSRLCMLPALGELSLFGCTSLELPAPHVGRCTALHTLSISKVRGFDQAWHQLCALRGMRSLVAQRCPMALEDLRALLAAWPQLRKLDLLPAVGIAQADFCEAVLASGVQLEWLAFPGSVALLPLVQPALRVLNLSKNVAVPAALLCAALARLTHLEELSILRPDPRTVNDALLRVLLALPALKALFVSGATALTDDPWIERNARGSGAPLVTLELAQCSSLSPRALLHVAQAFPGMRQLNLTSLAYGADELEELGRRGSQLRMLNAARNTWSAGCVHSFLRWSALLHLKVTKKHAVVFFHCCEMAHEPIRAGAHCFAI